MSDFFFLCFCLTENFSAPTSSMFFTSYSIYFWLAVYIEITQVLTTKIIHAYPSVTFCLHYYFFFYSILSLSIFIAYPGLFINFIQTHFISTKRINNAQRFSTPFSGLFLYQGVLMSYNFYTFLPFNLLLTVTFPFLSYTHTERGAQDNCVQIIIWRKTKISNRKKTTISIFSKIFLYMPNWEKQMLFN